MPEPQPSYGKPVEILLVEDNPADVRLTVEGLKDSKINNNLHAVADGLEAMRYLRQEGEYAEAVRPDIVLLDLNLPGFDGRQILEAIKSDETLKVIPVVVLTSSQAETDILRSYESHANAFVSKPVTFEGIAQVIRSLDSFWFTIVRLPPRPS